MDLPRWTLTDDELELQRKELQAAEQVFEQMGEEFDEDQLDQEIYEDQREKLDTIMPQLEAAGSDEEKLQLMKAALGPDVDENDVNGWFDVLFSPEDTGWDLPAPAENPKRREGLIELDEEIKTAGRNLADAATLLRSRVEGAGDVGAISELVDGVIHTTSLLMTEGLLEALPDGIRRIEPNAMLAMLEREMRQCETVIQSLELDARKSDRARNSDSVWALRGIVGELIAVLEAKKPAERPPPREEDCGDDVPI
ncbi:MAG: hypothetical protein P1V20_31040 [Verrucomicrobiales bacterium]|nr:hypothetical protein [Verrucomicrobiales bacterium]